MPNIIAFQKLSDNFVISASKKKYVRFLSNRHQNSYVLGVKMEKIFFNSAMSDMKVRPKRGQQQRFVNFAFTSDKEDKVELKQKSQPVVISQQKKDKTENKWTIRKGVDVATVVTYSALLGSAIYMISNKSKFVKLVEKRHEVEKKAATITNELKETANIITGKQKEGSILYKLFDQFGKFKENSEELTNNLTYGFGTLVVMPLVILFSPIGKKDATPEDRVFTVLRQPISFATVFAMQLSFDKIFKSLLKNINKYDLLKGTKVNGKEVQFKKADTLKNLGEKIEEYRKAHNIDCFQINTDCFKDEDLHSESVKYQKHIEEHGNKFTTNAVKALVNDVIGDEYKISNRVPLNKINRLLKNYTKNPSVLTEAIEHTLNACLRTRALKEGPVIIANSLFSQALGIMMLNVIYGKMMKKYTAFKESLAQGAQQNSNGGAK